MDAGCVEGTSLQWRGRKKSVRSPLLRSHYRRYVGPLAEDEHVHHICGNPWCVNPEHLEAVTRRDHVQRHRYAGLEAGFNETVL